MTKFKGILAVKVTAIFLSIVFLLGTLFFAVCIAAAAVTGAYTGEHTRTYDTITRSILRYYATEVAHSFRNGEDIDRIYGGLNFYYDIKTGDGKHFSNLSNNKNDYLTSDTVAYEYPDKNESQNTVSVTLYEKSAKETSDLLSITTFWLTTAYNMRYLSIILALSCFVLFIIVLIFIFCSAGYRRGADSPTKNYFDRIPFDVCTVLCTAAFICINAPALLAMNMLDVLSGHISQIVLLAVGFIAVLIVNYLILLGYSMSLATRIKVGHLFRDTVIYRIFAFIFNCFSRFFNAIKSLVQSIPLVWRTVIISTTISFFEFLLLIFAASRFVNPEFAIFLFICLKAVELPLIIWIAAMLKSLKHGGEAIAKGNLNEKIDTSKMPAELSSFGNTLNNISMGLSRALDERMKSERMKTELITNVSHDIKTPLTSIVNYVDLIQKEETCNEKINEYVEVLARHSARLKKLIDDLLEASKASTGNISVNIERCEVGVLLEQSLGEYTERLEAAALNIIVNQPEKPIFIMADGRRLWRVFDNLLSNICKYALPHTRVYINLESRDKKAVITFRNISREELNISGDELLERFVRGDASRNTEGSGLGLSIAKSLTELQGGSLTLDADGDLFKATIVFTEIE